MKDVRDMTFDEWYKMWDDLNVALFGEEEAKLYRELDRRRNRALKALWIAKGFKTYGEFEDWEREHMADKNAFMEEWNAKAK